MKVVLFWFQETQLIKKTTFFGLYANNPTLYLGGLINLLKRRPNYWL